MLDQSSFFFLSIFPEKERQAKHLLVGKGTSQYEQLFIKTIKGNKPWKQEQLQTGTRNYSKSIETNN